MNIKSVLNALFEPLSTTRGFIANDRRRWREDPLSHPELDAMSMRELGDVPFASTRADSRPR